MLLRNLFCFEEDTGGGSGGAGFEGHVDEAQQHIQQAAEAANQAAEHAPTSEQKAATRTVEEVLNSLVVEVKRLNDYNEAQAQKEIQNAPSVADEAGEAEEEEAEEAAPEVNVSKPPKRKKRRFNRKVERG